MTDHNNSPDSPKSLTDFFFDTSQPLPEKYQNPPGKYKWTKNGVIYDNETHRFVDNSFSVTKPGNPNRAKLISTHVAQVRLEAQLAAQQGVSRALLGSSDSFLTAWGNIVGNQAEMANDPSQGGNSTRAAEFVGRAAGVLATNEPKSSDADHDRAASIGIAFLEGLASRIADFDFLNNLDQSVTYDAEFSHSQDVLQPEDDPLDDPID